MQAARRAQPVSSQVTTAYVGPDLLGESPCWNPDDARLWWVDSFAPAIRRLDPLTGIVDHFAMPADIGSFAFTHDGALVAATRAGFLRVDIDGTTVRTRPIADPLSRDRRLMLNDGKCDRLGRYWCASVHSDFVGRQAELLRLDPDGTVARIDGGFVIGNGIAISPDESRFYLADSRDETVWVYDFDLARGTLSGRRRFFDTTDIDGRVDGATCDTDGNYWCALVHGGAVACISPAGQLIERIAVPAKHPTMVAFGGPRLDTLFVTSASMLLAPGERAAWPAAGALFRIDGLGARGVPEPRFGPPPPGSPIETP
ncbi:MAG: SMP-30/gluconolactonase/LRE family protein [Lautropia sp.]